MWMIKFVMEFVYVDDGLRSLTPHLIHCSSTAGLAETAGDPTTEDDGVPAATGAVRAREEVHAVQTPGKAHREGPATGGSQVLGPSNHLNLTSFK